MRQGRTVNKSGRDGLSVGSVDGDVSFDTGKFKGRHMRGTNSYTWSIPDLTFHLIHPLSPLLVKKKRHGAQRHVHHRVIQVIYYEITQK